VLLDGFTLWLSTLLGDDVPDIDALLDGPVAGALAAIDARPGPVVIVSDEVGLGTVPMHPNARAYRDLVGIAHQRVAAVADAAYLFVAGLPIELKGGVAS
jgi:adenosylcobinamide kinase/adenosylcobinamide-phosphate guanylyltransferase